MVSPAAASLAPGCALGEKSIFVGKVGGEDEGDKGDDSRGSAQDLASHSSSNSSLGPGLGETLGNHDPGLETGNTGDGCTSLGRALSRYQGRLPGDGEPELGLRSEEKQRRMGSEGIRLRCSFDAWEAGIDGAKACSDTPHYPCEPTAFSIQGKH